MSDVGKGPLPPAPRVNDGGGGQGSAFGGGGGGGGKKKKKKKGDHAAEVEEHAREVREVAKGKDIVEKTAVREKRPAAFDRKELMVVRSWLRRRPLEPTPNATALVQYPRLWNSKRGRYCKFKAPGAGGVYGLLRARPTY
jgi:hypothetical protein